MKNVTRISIQKPCSEKFENFLVTSNGGFCDSCSKEVIDFTKMTDTQVLSHFNSTSGETCGRFKKSQLKTYEPMMNNNSNNKLFSRGIAVMSFSLLSLCAVTNGQAQDTASNSTPIKTEVSQVRQQMIMGKMMVQAHTVKGTVIDEENEPLPGVNVVLKGTTVGVSTDFDGKFEFPRQLEVGNILIFSYIGFSPQEYAIKAEVSEVIDITITFDYSDIDLMGEVVVGGAFVSKRNIFQKLADLFRK